MHHKKGTVTIYGSAAIMLNCHNNRSTMDIDIRYTDQNGIERPYELEELIIKDKRDNEQS
jgi:hypothetical protein